MNSHFKKWIWILSLGFLGACTDKAPAVPKIQTWNYDSKALLSDVKSNSNYTFCLFKDKTLLALKNDYSIDSVLSARLSEVTISNLFMLKDTFYAIVADSLSEKSKVVFLSENNVWENFTGNLDSLSKRLDVMDTMRASNKDYDAFAIGHINGGFAYFRAKSDHQIFVLPVVATPIIRSMGGKFYVLASSDDHKGFTEMYTISDPSSLPKFNDGSPTSYHWPNSGETTTPGIQKLIDTTRVLAFDEIVVGEKFYLLLSDISKTFLASAGEGNKIEIVDTLLNFGFRKTNFIVNYGNEHGILSDSVSAFINTKGDKIRIVKFKRR